MKTIRQALPAVWANRISAKLATDPYGDLLDWDADSHCGKEVQAICALADQVMHAWPDQRREVERLAIAQVSVVCYG